MSNPDTAKARMRHFVGPRRTACKRLGTLLAAGAIAAFAGCLSLTPIEKLVIAQDAEPLLAQIRAGEVGINEKLPWGGALGVKPSYFTPLCAAAFGGAVAALDELLALGADVNAECSPSMTPLDLVMTHRPGPKAAAMGKLLQARGADTRWGADHVIQARL
jgi:hypothetical protein